MQESEGFFLVILEVQPVSPAFLQQMKGELVEVDD